MNIEAKVISPLEKAFYDDKLTKFKKYGNSSALLGEKASFVIAYTLPEFAEHCYSGYDCRITAKLLKNGKETDNSCVTVSAIEHVPSVFPAVLEEEPDEYVRSMPGLYPDLLVPIKAGETVRVLPRITASVWVEVNTENLDGGKYTVSVSFVNNEDNAVAAVAEHTLKVIPVRLPEQEMAVTHWIHTDAVTDYYGVKAFSATYWKAVRGIIKTAVDYGTNMIYTPLFTPPLDTAVGAERTTVQLVDVTEKDGVYAFDFEKLHKWVEICKECGAKFYEMSHLFTQWGAYHTPKIIVNGKRKFGWDTDAAGEEYESFLSQFLPELDKELKALDIADKTVFHISDEPMDIHLESYKSASRIMHKYLGGYKVMDAMEKASYYEAGLVDIPVPKIGHEEPFFKLGARPRWIYYCGAGKNCMGRAFGMHSSRNRISGVQFYESDADGFLHWGFNFCNEALSKRKINPFAVTDAGKRFISGDSFLVYPAPNYETYKSVRLEVFGEAIDDLRALRLCESLCGKEAVDAVLTELNGGKPVSLNEIPEDCEFTLKMRKKINAMIEKASK